MFKKILFLVILAGIGFGIYTGIHKIVEVVTAPKTEVSSVTGTTQPQNGIVENNDSSSSLELPMLSGTIDTPAASGWFSRTWDKIKSWFSSKTTEEVDSSLDMTGDEITEVISTGSSLSGALLSGEIFDEYVSTGESIETLATTGTETIDSNEIKYTTGKIIIDSGVTQTTTTTTIKKPTVKKITTTSTSGKDPVLKALFK